jgi:hypothetical protein
LSTNQHKTSNTATATKCFFSLWLKYYAGPSHGLCCLPPSQISVNISSFNQYKTSNTIRVPIMFFFFLSSLANPIKGNDDAHACGSKTLRYFCSASIYFCSQHKIDGTRSHVSSLSSLVTPIKKLNIRDHVCGLKRLPVGYMADCSGVFFTFIIVEQCVHLRKCGDGISCPKAEMYRRLLHVLFSGHTKSLINTKFKRVA